MMDWKYTHISKITNEEYNYYFSLMNKEKQQKVLACS